MKTRDLNGDIVDWKPKGEVVAAQDKRSRSKLHLDVRRILYDLFPTSQITEEVPIPVRRGTTQYFDFFINDIKLAVEAHGIQHYKYNSMYHSTTAHFLQQKKRDIDKREWCEINNITLIELPYSEGDEEWRTRIQNR